MTGAGSQVLDAVLARLSVAHEHTEIQARVERRIESGRLSAVFRISWHSREVHLGLADCFGPGPNVVFLDLAVEPRPIYAQQVRGLLFVSAGSLQCAFDDKLLDILEC